MSLEALSNPAFIQECIAEWVAGLVGLGNHIGAAEIVIWVYVKIGLAGYPGHFAFVESALLLILHFR
jgi:hypothetical protein